MISTRIIDVVQCIRLAQVSPTAKGNESMQLVDAIAASSIRAAQRNRRYGHVLYTLLVRPDPSPDLQDRYVVEVWLESNRVLEHPVANLDAVISTIRQLQRAGLLREIDDLDPADHGWAPFQGPVPQT